MSNISDGAYLKRITTLSQSELQNYVDKIYNVLKIRFGRDASFGPEGSREFVASLFLAEHDTTTTAEIFDALQKVFERQYTPLDFSNQMDNIVMKSNIEYTTWSSAFRYLKNNHLWIDSHPCGSLLGLVS